jgi:hypothetical protein
MCPHCKRQDSKIVKRRYPDGRFDWMCSACGRRVEEPEGTGEIVLYDKMVLAINECHRTDEVKDIRDRALALEYYARQAQNVEAERKAAEIRIRAERKAGELLKETERGKTGPKVISDAAEQLSEYAKAKKDGKISDDQADRWQRLAEIPDEEFEQALSDPDIKPSTSGLIKEEKPPSFLKPIIDLPAPPGLDNNPRTCRASCCPEGSELTGPFGLHDAQLMLDQKGYRYGHFGKDHNAILDFGVECDQHHLLEQLHGRMTPSAIEFRSRRYRGIGQGRK